MAAGKLLGQGPLTCCQDVFASGMPVFLQASFSIHSSGINHTLSDHYGGLGGAGMIPALKDMDTGTDAKGGGWI